MINQTVIKNLTPETGKEIIKYFQSFGVDTRKITGCCIEGEVDNDYIYYGVINGVFDNYSLKQVTQANATIIELPKQPQFKRGDKVLVWDNNKSRAEERIFLAEIDGANYPIIVVTKKWEKEFYKGDKFHISYWKFCKASNLVELTLQDISEGKGVGVPVELIRINL